jgi:putative ABC transport system permease protein
MRLLLPGLAARSLWNRRATAALIVLAVAISVALLLTVRTLANQARNAFMDTVSGTDLIVGARSGQLNLLLYSVFRLGDATNNVSWETYQKLARHREVAWAIPLSLGDSHRGFRVLGTNDDYFRYYRFGNHRALEFASGQPPRDLYDAVVGADVARTLGYELNDRIVIAHGLGSASFAEHSDRPFVIAGILRSTGTPVDRTVHVRLEAIEAIHIDWQSGAPAPLGERTSAQAARSRDLTPKTVTAMLIGLKSKLATFRMQRAINDYGGEPLLAILPGVALQQLWGIVGVVEQALAAVASVVVIAALLCLLTSILTGLNERRREMAILRSVGARPAHVFLLFMSEAGLLAVLGVVAGIAINQLAILAARPLASRKLGLLLEVVPPSGGDIAVLLVIIGAALLVGAIPAWQAYRRTLADGLTMRI